MCLLLDLGGTTLRVLCALGRLRRTLTRLADLKLLFALPQSVHLLGQRIHLGIKKLADQHLAASRCVMARVHAAMISAMAIVFSLVVMCGRIS